MGFLESRCCSKWKLPLCWNRQLKQPTCLSSPSAVADWLFLLQYLCRWSQENRPVQNVGLAPQRVAQKVPPDLKPLATRRGGMKKVQKVEAENAETRRLGPFFWAPLRRGNLVCSSPNPGLEVGVHKPKKLRSCVDPQQAELPHPIWRFDVSDPPHRRSGQCWTCPARRFLTLVN